MFVCLSVKRLVTRLRTCIEIQDERLERLRKCFRLEKEKGNPLTHLVHTKCHI